MNYNIILPTLILMFSLSCSPNVPSDEEIEQRAYRAIEMLDEQTLDTFRHWLYVFRGSEIWVKRYNYGYYCYYNKRTPEELSVLFIENFKRDFPYSIDIDTSKVSVITFTKIDNEEIKVSSRTNCGADTLLVNKIKLDDLFIGRNPFITIENLSNLKDSLQIIGTFYRPDIGEFMQFYLTNRHVLTYIPDTLEMKSGIKKIWMNEFAKGKYLKKNWNLRKLDKPKDNG